MSGPRARARAVRPLPTWIALLVSVCAHAALLLGGLWIGGGAMLAGGDGGRYGAGGDTIEVTVAGWEASSGSGDAEGARVAEPEAEPEPEVGPAPEAEPAPERPGRRSRPLLAARDSTDRAREVVPSEGAPAGGQEAPSTASTSASAEAGAEGPARPERLGNSDADRSGRAAGDRVAAAILGSVGLGGSPSSARALLEGSLGCSDPIAGVWTAHRYSAARRDWARMTLRIQREGDELRGTITSRVWSGLPSDRRPLPCAPGRFDITVRMPARGRIDGDRFSFGASSYEVVRSDCPSPDFAYYPDRFSGRVDTLREELDAVNNDGFVEFDAPYTFRRTQCLE